MPLHALSAEAFDALFLPGGHGTMFDLPGNPDLEKVIRAMYESGKVVAAVCHGPAGFVDMRLSDGQYLVKGKKIDLLYQRGGTGREARTVYAVSSGKPSPRTGSHLREKTPLVGSRGD